MSFRWVEELTRGHFFKKIKFWNLQRPDRKLGRSKIKTKLSYFLFHSFFYHLSFNATTSLFKELASGTKQMRMALPAQAGAQKYAAGFNGTKGLNLPSSVLCVNEAQGMVRLKYERSMSSKHA